MKIWTVNECGVPIEGHATKREAGLALRQYRKSDPEQLFEIQCMDIPTRSKAAMIDWLHWHLFDGNWSGGKDAREGAVHNWHGDHIEGRGE